MTNNFLSQVVVFLAFSILMSVGSIAHPAIVVVDPGHGGIDRGGIPGQKLAEKVFTLDTGKRLAKILRSNGGIKVPGNGSLTVSIEDDTHLLVDLGCPTLPVLLAVEVRAGWAPRSHHCSPTPQATSAVRMKTEIVVVDSLERCSPGCVGHPCELATPHSHHP
jgi:hypothetical protein